MLQHFLGKQMTGPEEEKPIFKVFVTDKQVNSEELHGYSRLCTQAVITISFHGDLTILTGMVLS